MSVLGRRVRMWSHVGSIILVPELFSRIALLYVIFRVCHVVLFFVGVVR